MTLSVARLQTGMKAALRALVPVAFVVAGMVQAGTIHRWTDLFTLQSLSALFGALVAKGVFAAVIEHKDG